MLAERSQDRRLQHGLRAMVLSRGRHADDAPRFWELEALISAGCDLTEALTVIAARREFSDGDGRRDPEHSVVTPVAPAGQASVS